MGLRINNNVAALMAQRNMGRSDANLSRSLERLSSGLRINRAADDPAGLVISEQQRAQIAGLNQAIENSERGISMIQTAEGQLAEVNALLVKMRGLILDASNDAVNDANSLAADQAEIEDAIATIDRIASTAQFGSKLLFDGSNENSVTQTTTNLDVTLANSTFSTGVYTLTVDAATFNEATYSIDSSGAAALGMTADPGAGNYGLSGLAAGTHTLEVTTATAAAALSGTAAVAGSALVIAAASNDQIRLTVDQNGTLTSATLTLSANTYTDGADLADEINTQIAAGGLANLVTASASSGALVLTTADEGSAASVRIQTATNDWLTEGGTTGFTADDIAYGTDGVVQLDNHANTVSYVSSGTLTTQAVEDLNGNQAQLEFLSTGLRLGSTTMTVAVATGEVHFGSVTAVAFTAGQAVTLQNSDGETMQVTVGLGLQAAGTDTITVTNNALTFQIGPNAGQTARVSLVGLATTELGQSISGNQFSSLNEIQVTTLAKANDALDIVDVVINELTSVRGDLGSFQANALESNLAALRVAAENLTAAESVIRDTDFSTEVAEFTKQQILLQAGSTVLMNASQIPQIVLQLLR